MLISLAITVVRNSPLERPGEPQFDDPEAGDLLHAGRANLPYGFWQCALV